MKQQELKENMITRKVKNQYGEELTNNDVDRILSQDDPIASFIHNVYWTGYNQGVHETDVFPDIFKQEWTQELREMIRKAKNE